MIREGLVKLVNAGLGSSIGGFGVELAKDQPLPSWSYTYVSSEEKVCQGGEHGFVLAPIQVDCYAASLAEALALSRSIDAILNCYRGALPDADATYVHGCFPAGETDLSDDAGRTFRVMLQYDVQYTKIP